MSDELQAKINELKTTIEQATVELKKLIGQIDIAKREEWVGLYFKVVRQHVIIDGLMADRLVSYYQIVGFNHQYPRYYGLRVEMAEYWESGDRRVKMHLKEIVDPRWLLQHGDILSRPEFRVAIEDLLRYVLPFRVILPQRPMREEMCPCSDCFRCCCRWVEGLDENNCVNFEEFGRCICEHENDDPAAIMTDEEVEAAIKKYEQQFGMGSEEFLEQVRLGAAPDEDGIIGWKLLLKYR